MVKLFIHHWLEFAHKYRDAFCYIDPHGCLQKGMYCISGHGPRDVFMQYCFRGEGPRRSVYNLYLVNEKVRVVGPVDDANRMDREFKTPEEAHRAILARQRERDMTRCVVDYRPVWVDNDTLGRRRDDVHQDWMTAGLEQFFLIDARERRALTRPISIAEALLLRATLPEPVGALSHAMLCAITDALPGENVLFCLVSRVDGLQAITWDKIAHVFKLTSVGTRVETTKSAKRLLVLLPSIDEPLSGEAIDALMHHAMSGIDDTTIVDRTIGYLQQLNQHVLAYNESVRELIRIFSMSTMH